VAGQLSAANVHDSKLLEPLLEAVEPIRRPTGEPGRPRKRPAKLHGEPLDRHATSVFAYVHLARALICLRLLTRAEAEADCFQLSPSATTVATSQATGSSRGQVAAATRPDTPAPNSCRATSAPLTIARNFALAAGLEYANSPQSLVRWIRSGATYCAALRMPAAISWGISIR
jgi:hypothetical protein